MDFVRVRGKRGARPEEKWNFGKRRDPALRQRRPNTTNYGHLSVPEHLIATSAMVDHDGSDQARPRKKRRRVVSHSPLEALPPEVLQTIFAYSANVALPLTSTQLAFKLCNSMHLRYELSDHLIKPILGFDTTVHAPAADLARATRLLNSRFMDLVFFKTWLRSRFRGQTSSTPSSDQTDNVDWHALWSSCRPSKGLLPPRKLFLAHLSSQETTTFLSILSQNISNIAELSPSYAELAYDALATAIQKSNIDLVSILLRTGVIPTTDLLRAAVIDAPCDKHTVELLLRSDNVELLDPMVWSWAEKTPGKGEWLMNLLRETQEERQTAAG